MLDNRLIVQQGVELLPASVKIVKDLTREAQFSLLIALLLLFGLVDDYKVGLWCNFDFALWYHYPN